MKACFAAVILSFVSCVAFGGEDATKSVLQQPTLAEPATVESPAIMTASADCAHGRCARLYNVETECSESCRNRLFGGHVVRKTNRTVYRPARR